MSGRWADSDRASRLPANWPQLREATRQRAGGRCEGRARGHRCPNPGSECDHIRASDDHRPTNLQWLCTGCHRAKTQREAIAARHALRAQRYRTPEQHPGQRPPGAR